MEKKVYIAPQMELVEIETTAMLAASASIGIGRGNAKADQSFTNDRNDDRQWGNIWAD